MLLEGVIDARLRDDEAKAIKLEKKSSSNGPCLSGQNMFSILCW